MLSGEGHARRRPPDRPFQGFRPRQDRLPDAHGGGAVPLRPVRSLPSRDPGRDGLQERADHLAHQQEQLRRFRVALADHGAAALAGHGRQRHAPQDAPQDPPVRDRPRRLRRGLRPEHRVCWRRSASAGPVDVPPHGRDDRRAGPLPRPVPRGARPLQARPPADRRGRRDFLPPEHLQQLRGGPQDRSPRRRGVAVRHDRVGLVHQLVAEGAAPPRWSNRIGLDAGRS